MYVFEGIVPRKFHTGRLQLTSNIQNVNKVWYSVTTAFKSFVCFIGFYVYVTIMTPTYWLAVD